MSEIHTAYIDNEIEQELGYNVWAEEQAANPDAEPIDFTFHDQLLKHAREVRANYFGHRPKHNPTRDDVRMLTFQIQEGLNAEKAFGSSDKAALLPVRTQIALEDKIQKGKESQDLLVMVDMPYALEMVRESMGLNRYSHNAFVRRQKRHLFKTFIHIDSLRSRFADMDSRINLAVIGMYKAAREYKPGHGSSDEVGFLGFAKWRIATELYNQFATESPLISGMEERLDPSDEGHTKHAFFNAILYKDNLITAPGDDITGSDWDPSEILTIPDLVEDTGVDVTRSGIIVHETNALHRLLDQLPERHCQILMLRAQGLTFDEIGLKFGVTRERVRQMHGRGMEMLMTRYMVSKSVAPDISTSEHPRGLSAQIDGGTLSLLTIGRSGATYTPVPKDPYPRNVVLQPQEEIFEIAPSQESEQPVDETAQSPEEESIDVKALLAKHHEGVAKLSSGLSILHARHLEATQGSGYYPNQAISFIKELVGPNLTAEVIAQVWSTNAAELTKRIPERVRRDRLGLLLSALLQDVITEQDDITLDMSGFKEPIHNMCVGLSKGRVTIVGDVGDFAGVRLRGTAKLIIEGSVGHRAFSASEDRASIHIKGNTGREFATASTTSGHITVDGSISSIGIAPDLKADIVYGSLERETVGATVTRARQS